MNTIEQRSKKVFADGIWETEEESGFPMMTVRTDALKKQGVELPPMVVTCWLYLSPGTMTTEVQTIEVHTDGDDPSSHHELWLNGMNDSEYMSLVEALNRVAQLTYGDLLNLIRRDEEEH